MVIESIGGTVTSEALSSLGVGSILITLGYSAGTKTTIDVTDLIWKRAQMAGRLRHHPVRIHQPVRLVTITRSDQPPSLRDDQGRQIPARIRIFDHDGRPSHTINDLCPELQELPPLFSQ